MGEDSIFQNTFRRRPSIMKKFSERLTRFLSKENVDKYYTLKKELGCGNFSIVRLAVRKDDGKEFAVKVIEKKRVGQKKDMLETEVEILRQVDHPHVVHMEAMFETPSHLYLVMELVPGGELFDLLVDRGSFSEKEASAVMRQVLSGVEYLHSLGIAHRDLKPENLLCAGHSVESDIKITDFGLRRSCQATSLSRRLTGATSRTMPRISSPSCSASTRPSGLPPHRRSSTPGSPASATCRLPLLASTS